MGRQAERGIAVKPILNPSVYVSMMVENLLAVVTDKFVWVMSVYHGLLPLFHTSLP